MQKPASNHDARRGGSTTRTILVVAVVAVIGVLIWFTGSRIRELNRELAASEQRAVEMNEELREYSEELEDVLGRARSARNRAESAEQQVEETTAALTDAEQQVQSVTAEREQARLEATEARAETSMTREELAKIKERRQMELDRMQAALNRIAPTKRTPSGMVMMLSDKDFRFDFDKAALKPDNREKLSRIAGILLASEGYRLFIDGHTDDVGNAKYNLGLSERRATTVRDYLVDAGIPSALIEVSGFGKDQPLVKAKTRDARAMNRRVEIGIVDTIIHYEKPSRN